jgi:hypothetical protein
VEKKERLARDYKIMREADVKHLVREVREGQTANAQKRAEALAAEEEQ